MANEEHLKILRQGVAVWNQWRKENLEMVPDLSEVDLSEVNLSEVNLYRTDLFAANLSKANLRQANLSDLWLTSATLAEADLSEARLRDSHLFGADFSGATLTKADLSGANLHWGILFRADLSGANLITTDLSGTTLIAADFSKATVGGTMFGHVDLSMAKGLETMIHEGPSYIDIHTIYFSKGNIPEVFLRSAGVPDTFIAHIRSLVGQPIHFYSCFISHSTKDKRFCDCLYADLQANGVRVWYFPDDATWGEPMWGEIDRSIRIYDKLVVVCSKNSLQSGPVLREIERALNREDREGRNILFPIRIDDYIFDRWEHPRKADVVSKVVGDFSGWNRSATKYDAAFKKLLSALEAEESAG